VEAVYAELRVHPRFEQADEPLLHPGKAARTGEGWLGELHPAQIDGTWGVFELDLETLFARVPERLVYEDVITYPPVHQDLAFIVDVDVPAAELFDAAREAAGPELREVSFLSDYREPPIPDGKKSLAFSVSFQSAERTLTDEDAAALRERIVAALQERFGAELRA
jgi:phenylalanyl-tRNA synthetase beta chain